MTIQGTDGASLALTSSATAYAVRFLVAPLARAMRDVTAGGTAAIEWQELVNKTDVITAVDAAPDDPGSLPQRLRDANRPDAFIRLWILEGMGRRSMELVLRQQQTVTFSKTIPDAASPGARAMLHAGMGMALAIALLGQVPSCCAHRELEIGVREFVQRCCREAQRGYAGAAVESLGLVVRFLRPDLVAAVDRVLCDAHPQAVGYFWHGAGRAVYFLPANMLEPLTGIRRDVESTRVEPPHGLGRANALVGWAWAVVLVNMQDPCVIESAFRHCHPTEAAPLAYAVWSAAVIRLAVDRTDDFVAKLLHYRPQSPDAAFAKFWNAIVLRPAACARRSKIDGLERLYRIDVSDAVTTRRTSFGRTEHRHCA